MSINVLPPEILTKVMLLASNRREYLTLSGKGAPVPFPVVLSSVCRRWRDVSLDSPAIWSSFAVDLWPSNSSAAADPQRYYERLHRVLRMFLERSNNHLLDIELDTEWRFIPGENHFEDAMRMLSDNAHRWGTLILRGEANFPVVWIESTSSLTNNLVALHTLIIHENVNQRLASDQSILFLKWLGTLPALQHLALSVGLRPLTRYLDSFSRLETLQIAALSERCGPEIRNMINVCASLRSLTLSFPSYKGRLLTIPGGDIPPTPLNIESLHLRKSSHNMISNFLGFTFPRLSSITIGAISQNYELEPVFMDGFVELLQRSSTITSLTFDGTRAIDVQVVQLLTHLPSLTTLTIRDPGVLYHSNPVILTPHLFKQVSAGLVPLLERFHIHTMSRSITASAEAIAEMIRSRYADKRLRTVLIRLAGWPIPEEMNALEALSQEGLQVDVVETPWIRE